MKGIISSVCNSGRVYRVAIKCTTRSCIDCCTSIKIIFTSSCRNYMLSGTLVLVRCTSNMRWTHSVTRRMSLLWRLAGTRLKWSARTSVTENREHLSPFYRYVIWWSYIFVQLFVASLIPGLNTFHNCYQCRFLRGRNVKGYGMCAYVHACRLVLMYFQLLNHWSKWGNMVWMLCLWWPLLPCIFNNRIFMSEI